MTRVPYIANWGVFASSRIFMLATIAAADSASTVREKYSVFMYSEAEPRAMYAIYKQTRKLCVLQYIDIYTVKPQLSDRSREKSKVVVYRGGLLRRG